MYVPTKWWTFPLFLLFLSPHLAPKKQSSGCVGCAVNRRSARSSCRPWSPGGGPWKTHGFLLRLARKIWEKNWGKIRPLGDFMDGKGLKSEAQEILCGADVHPGSGHSGGGWPPGWMLPVRTTKSGWIFAESASLGGWCGGQVDEFWAPTWCGSFQAWLTV